MLELAWPWIFLLLPLPWLLRRLLPPAEHGDAALRVPFLDELQGLAGPRANRTLPAWRRQWPLLAIWLLLLLAAARPQWLGAPLALPSTGRDLMLAIDISGSMDYPDMRWEDRDITRLDMVQRLLGDFIEGRHGDRIGLILFGSKAYLQAPLTFDRHTVRTWLDEARVGLAGGNTAIGDAIGLALKRLRERPTGSRVLVLVTDGASNGGEIDPLVAARLAASEGVRIHTLGIGAAPGQGDTSSLFGFNPAVELDEPTLRAIAETTGGRYFHAASVDDLRTVGHTLDQIEPVAQSPDQLRAVRALYSWPLAMALLLSLLLAARGLLPARWRRAVP